MIETCERLSQYVRHNLGSPNAIALMKVYEQHGFVSFRWYERDFVVKRTLEVFEVKGENLLVTGASMLMQVILTKAETNKNVVEVIVNSIHQAEDLIADDQQRNSGFELLATVKATLRKLSKHKSETPLPGSTDSLNATRFSPPSNPLSAAKPANVADFEAHSLLNDVHQIGR